MIQYKNLTFKIISNKNITSFAKEKTSSYLSVLTNDATYIEENYLYSLFEIIMLLFSFIGAVALMLWYNWIMTLRSRHTPLWGKRTVARMGTFFQTGYGFIAGSLVLCEQRGHAHDLDPIYA